MYSTIERAKKCAKELKLLFDSSGIKYPLHRCQLAIARAGNYRDWNDLEGALSKAPRSLDPQDFRRNLLEALPEPCRLPAMAWLDRDPTETALTEGIPPRWYRDVFPYFMAIAAAYNRTALLKPRSGTGQKLREQLVLGALLNTRGAASVPWLDPDTLDLLLTGDIGTVFGEDARHPRFETELGTLVAAGVIAIEERSVRFRCPDADRVRLRVADDRAEKARHWSGVDNEEARISLHNALASIGVRNGRRVADAIVAFGDSAYITPSGAVLTLLSDLAAEGDLYCFAQAYVLFATLRPDNAGFVRESVPAKINSGFFARHRRLNGQRIAVWANTNSDWPERLKDAVSKPPLFVATAVAMAEAIAAPA